MSLSTCTCKIIIDMYMYDMSVYTCNVHVTCELFIIILELLY